jgi:hypothetical protein
VDEEFEFFILNAGVTICSLAFMPIELILLVTDVALDWFALDRCEDTGLTYVSITALFFLPPIGLGVAASVKRKNDRDKKHAQKCTSRVLPLLQQIGVIECNQHQE